MTEKTPEAITQLPLDPKSHVPTVWTDELTFLGWGKWMDHGLNVFKGSLCCGFL
jgi:hypothetical protein